MSAAAAAMMATPERRARGRTCRVLIEDVARLDRDPTEVLTRETQTLDGSRQHQEGLRIRMAVERNRHAGLIEGDKRVVLPQPEVQIDALYEEMRSGKNYDGVATTSNWRPLDPSPRPGCLRRPIHRWVEPSIQRAY